MAVMELWRRRDLEGAVKTEYIDGNFFTQDSVGNLVGVKVYSNGAEAALTGSVTGYCVLPSGETIEVAGSRSGNEASILVPQSALAYTGPLGIVLKLIDGNTITTLMSIIVVVYRSKTDNVITPSSQVITDWSNQIAAAMQDVADASAAQDVKIADLKSAFGGYKLAVNGQLSPTWISGGYVNKTGGEASSSAWDKTGYTPIGGKYLLITCPLSSNTTQLNNVAAIAFYKMQSASTFISYKAIESGTFGETKYALVEVPQTAGFAKFSRATGTTHEIHVLYDIDDQFAIGIADNILPAAGFRSGDYSTNGIVFKTNDDLSVTINGTATANAIYNIVVSTDHFTLEPGLYCLSGAETGDANAYIHLTVGTEQYVQHTTPRIIRVTETSEYMLSIRVMSGKVMNNVTFRPMLERGAVAHDYFPAKYNNKSLYDGIISIASENLLQFPYNSKYPKYMRRGITFVVNSDGSVTMNGTATADAYYMFVSKNQGLSLPAGQYTLSGCEGGSLTTYSMRIYGTGGDGMVCTTDPVTQQYDTDLLNYRFFIYVKSGTTVSNVTIKPMLEKGAVAHAYKAPAGVMDTIRIGGVISDKIKNAVRIFHQPWIALRDLDYYSQRGETTENSEYIGVPYASVFSIGGDVLYQRNLSTFFSAVKNPASIMYQELKLVNGASVQSNYGAVCTSFTGWLHGMPLQVNANELPSFGFERYDYTGIDNVAIGDCLLTVSNQHCIQIYDISVDATTFNPVYIHLTDQSGSGARVMQLTVSEFEDMLIQNGGAYELGRYPNQDIVDIEKTAYATDVIPDMGDKTYYYIGDTVEIYVGSNASTIYLKKDDGNFTAVALSGLSNRTVNDVTVYDITSLTAAVGTYTITTNTNNYTKCQIKRINTGTITINGTTFTLTGYSDNLTPVWVQVFSLSAGEQGIYPSPSGYVAHGYSKVLIDSDTFNLNLPSMENYDGYYVRINYDTGFGQAFKDSEFIMY